MRNCLLLLQNINQSMKSANLSRFLMRDSCLTGLNNFQVKIFSELASVVPKQLDTASVDEEHLEK